VEEIKLLGCHLDRAVIEGDLSRPWVDAKCSECQSGGVISPGLCSPQHGLDPGGQLARRERFHDVVVGSHPEPGDPIDLVTPAGEKDDRHVAGLPESLEHVAPVFVGQADVEQNQIGLLAAHGAECRRAVTCDVDAVPFRLQQPQKKLTQVRVVVDDQYPSARGLS
jgi:hypothetical protein